MLNRCLTVYLSCVVQIEVKVQLNCLYMSHTSIYYHLYFPRLRLNKSFIVENLKRKKPNYDFKASQQQQQQSKQLLLMSICWKYVKQIILGGKAFFLKKSLIYFKSIFFIVSYLVKIYECFNVESYYYETNLNRDKRTYR